MDLKKYLLDQVTVAQEALVQYDVDMAKAKADGIEEGRAQIQLPEEGTGEKRYTQEQMSAAVSQMESNTKAALQPIIDEQAFTVCQLKSLRP